MTRGREHFFIAVLTMVLPAAGPARAQPRDPPAPPPRDQPAAPPRDQPAATPHSGEIKKLGGKIIAKGFKSSWSPDGKRIVFGGGIPGTRMDTTGGLTILDLATGKTTVLVKIGKDPVWSPKDGRLIAYVCGNNQLEEIWVVASAGGGSRKIADGGFPTWLADAKTIFYQSRKQRTLMAVDASAPAARPKIVLPMQYWYPAVSLDGKRVAYRSGREVIIADTKTGRKLRTWPMPDTRAGFLGAWSPDGIHVGFGRYGRSDHFGLWMLNTNTGEAFRLTAGPFTMPAWSRDGTKIAFDYRTPNARAIWMIKVEAVAALSVRSIARVGTADRVALTDGNVLLGTIRNEEFTLTASFGEVKIPVTCVVGLAPAADGLGMRLTLADSQILTGALKTKTLKVVVGTSAPLKIPLAKIAECGWRITADKPAALKAGAAATTIKMRNGDRLLGKLTDKKLTLKTEFGPAPLLPAKARTMTFDPKTPRLLIARMFDGTTLRGQLVEKTLAVTIAIGSVTVMAKIPAKEIVAIIPPAPKKSS